MADDRTYKEALDNVEVIIDECIEIAQSIGREIHKPKGKLLYV